MSIAAKKNVQLIAAAMRRFYPDPAKRVEALKGLRGENPDSIATQMEAENERRRREFRKLPLAERNPLLGHIQRRLDLASLRDLTDAATIKELQRKLPFLAKSKAKGGLAIDVLADELVTRGLLPEGSGASELLSYLQDVDLNGAFEGKTLYQVAPPVESEAFKKWFGNSKVVDENGKPLIVYHGTARPDRVGEKFDPRRATSGPMALFTTDPEIGSNYAMGKQDTSLAYDEPNAGMYENWFRVKVGRGKPISIDKAWYRLSDEEQSKIKKLASRVTEEDGEIILADEGHTNGIGNYEWEIKQHRGNAAAALV